MSCSKLWWVFLLGNRLHYVVRMGTQEYEIPRYSLAELWWTLSPSTSQFLAFMRFPLVPASASSTAPSHPSAATPSPTAEPSSTLAFPAAAAAEHACGFLGSPLRRARAFD